MELSRISLVGTPVLNRPCSEMMDDDLTMSVMRVGGGRPITSSGESLTFTHTFTHTLAHTYIYTHNDGR